MGKEAQVEEEDAEMDYEASGGIERAFHRNVTAKVNKKEYLWKDPLSEEVIKQAVHEEEYKQVAELVKRQKLHQDQTSNSTSC